MKRVSILEQTSGIEGGIVTSRQVEILIKTVLLRKENTDGESRIYNLYLHRTPHEGVFYGRGVYNGEKQLEGGSSIITERAPLNCRKGFSPKEGEFFEGKRGRG